MQAVIFDMDGLLIDSEPLWREAEIAVFAALGVRLTDDLCRESTGLRTDEVVRHWHRRFPWNEPTRDQVTKQLLETAERLIVERGTLIDGALEAVSKLHADGIKLAIASSSPMRLIQTVVEKFSIGRYFSVMHSAEHEIAGKPDPAVYRTAISLLGCRPDQCVAIEDSPAGVRSAKSAGARVVAVPATENAYDPGFALADVVLASLQDFSLDRVRSRNRQQNL